MITTLPYNEKVSFFFGRNSLEDSGVKYHSTLALIFNDIKECGDPGSNRLAFPRAMCLMVAIDLLAKMYVGSDQGEIGKRFKVFANFALPHEGADIGDKIWSFRNALHHSYRLPTDWKPTGMPFVDLRFRLADVLAETWITKNIPNGVIINLPYLQKEIEAGIVAFHSQIAACTDAAEKAKFSEMFDKYGWLSVSEMTAP